MSGCRREMLGCRLETLDYRLGWLGCRLEKLDYRQERLDCMLEMLGYRPVRLGYRLGWLGCMPEMWDYRQERLGCMLAMWDCNQGWWESSLVKLGRSLGRSWRWDRPTWVRTGSDQQMETSGRCLQRLMATSWKASCLETCQVWLSLESWALQHQTESLSCQAK